MRCFLAIELSDEARAHVAAVQSAMRELLPQASYPRVENLHVTLKFLGETSDRQIDALSESMRHIKLDGALRLSAGSVTGFPQRGPARVVVASMTGSESIVAALHQAVEQRSRKIGFEAEQRRYHPHVTLARSSRGVESPLQRQLADHLRSHWPGPSFEVRQFVLFQSQLHPQGSRYIKLATFRFGPEWGDE